MFTQHGPGCRCPLCYEMAFETPKIENTVVAQKHEWMTDGIALDASERILAEYEAKGWQLVTLQWDSQAGVFMGCWKRPAGGVNSIAVHEAASRLRSWIRDYGDQKQPYFIADLETVLKLISTAE